jgi:molecular chaperone HtpG
VLKEGVVEDSANSERIAKLLRMSSTSVTGDELTSLPEYVKRMAEGQKSIYYLTAESLTAARSSPHLEGFAKRGYEVLLLADRIDEWVVSHLTEFDGKPLKSVAQGAAELDDVVETAEQSVQEGAFKDVLARVKTALEDRVQDVQLSKRLTESPSCLIAPDFGMSRRLEKMLLAGGEKIARSKPILELNAAHPLVERLKETNDNALFADLAELLYGQAQLAEGGQLDDPGAFVKRLNRLVLGQAPSGRIIVS